MDNSTQIPASGEGSASSGNKIMLFFVGGLVLVVLLVGGAYLFMSRQQAEKNARNKTGEAATQPMAQVTPRPQDTVDALDKDLSAVDVGSGESDFSSIDSDLQQL